MSAAVSASLHRNMEWQGLFVHSICTNLCLNVLSICAIFGLNVLSICANFGLNTHSPIYFFFLLK